MGYAIAHIFLSLISLPILVAWGLPLSWLSPFGNALFNPLLSLFLLICSLSFVCEIIGIPHALLDQLLEQLAGCWHYALHQAPSAMLYGFYTPSWWLLGSIAITAIAIVMHPRLRSPKMRLASLSFLLFVSMSFLQAYRPKTVHDQVACNAGQLTILHANNKTIVIDPGFIGSRISAPSYMQHTFLPELLRRTGRLTIDYFIMLKPSILTFSALQAIVDSAPIGTIYMPSMQGALEGSLRRAFFKFYAVIKQADIQLVRLYKQDHSFNLSKSDKLSFQALGSKKYQTISYQRYTLSGSIAGNDVLVDGR